MSGETAASLIREVGIYRLADLEGCACGGFSLQNISCEIACRKGGNPLDDDFYGTTVRVHSGSLGISEVDLQTVGDEVVRQFAANFGGPIRLRLCSYEDDRQKRCSWCHEPRAEQLGYYCPKHLSAESRGF